MHLQKRMHEMQASMWSERIPQLSKTSLKFNKQTHFLHSSQRVQGKFNKKMDSRLLKYLNQMK